MTEKLIIFAIAIPVLIIFLSLGAYPHMWLFNKAVADTFLLNHITYWQSFWMLIYLSIFVGASSASSSK